MASFKQFGKKNRSRLKFAIGLVRSEMSFETFPNIYQEPRKIFLTQVFNLVFSFKVWVFTLFLRLFLPGHASMKQALLSVLYPLHCVPSHNLALA